MTNKKIIYTKPLFQTGDADWDSMNLKQLNSIMNEARADERELILRDLEIRLTHYYEKNIYGKLGPEARGIYEDLRAIILFYN